MLSKTRIMCANNPKCCKDGKCTWVGDIGSYQEHIRSCKNTPGPSPAILEEATVVEAEERVQTDSEQSGCDVLCESCSSEPEILQTEDTFALGYEVPAEDAIVQLDDDDQLTTGLVDQLLHVKSSQHIDSEDTCSTHESETPASDVMSEPTEPSETSDLQTVMPITDEDPTVCAKPLGWQGPGQISPEAAKAYQAAAQWQMHQYRAAQYQAAQWQMAQWQMAQYQAAQARAMQWQMAQRYHHHQQQQQDRNAAGNNRR